MKNKFLFFCLFLLVFYFSFLFAQASVVINEIMYNPDQCSDSDCEWIELYNPTFNNISLDGWKFSELTGSGKEENHSIPLTTIFSRDYLILVRNEDIFLKYFCSECHIVEVPFGGGLNNNDPERITIYSSDGSLVDEIYFNNLMGADGDNNSLQLCNDELIPNLPTPGAENNCTQQGQQEEPTIELDYPSEVDCDEEFEIELDAFNFENGEYDIKIDIMGEDEENIDGYVWGPNEDKWLSTNYYVNSILDVVDGVGTVTLKFKIEDFEGEAILRPKIRDIGTFDDYYLSVECKIQEESKIDIIDAPDEARFGENIEIEIEVYRGNTAKYAVYVYVQDNDSVKVSNKISLHFDEKFEPNIEIVKLVLKCKNEQGTYEIIAEGLDELDREQIYLEPCEEEGEEETKKEQTKSESTIEQETTNNYKSVSSNTVLESENFLITKGMPYFLTTISLILVIYLIIKKI